MSKPHNTNLFLSLHDIDKREGCIAITATISAVKATMCRLVLEKGDTPSQAESILNKFIYEKGSFESILSNFGIIGHNSEKRSKKEMICRLIQYLFDAMNEGVGALIIIEDDQLLPLPVSNENSLLSILNKNKNKLLQVILVGKNAKMQVLKSPQLKQLYQMFSAEYSLSQFKNEEIQKYLEDRLMPESSSGGTIFFSETMALIRQHSLGMPCIINFISSCRPICTFTNQTIEKTEEDIQKALDSLKTHRKEILMLCPDDNSGGSDIVNWVRKTFAWPNSINQIRKNYLLLTMVVLFVSVGAIVFPLSKDTNIINIIDHKPEYKVPVLNEESTFKSGELEKKELFTLAVSHQKKGEFIIARDQFKELARRFPVDHEVHNNLGFVYMKLGDSDAAMNEYRKAILIKPNYYKARNNLGVALHKEGNLQEAIDEFNIILEANPKDVQCITTLGEISKELGNPETARKLFKEALFIDPTYEEAHYNLAIDLEESDVSMAIFHFQKYIEYSIGMDSSLEEDVVRHLDFLYKKQN